MTDKSIETRKLAALAPIIPVLVVDDVADAMPLAQALVRGGLPVLEVTLRTDAALDVIAAMAGVEGARVGAGTLVSEADVDAAMKAGATFGVSPGGPSALVDICEARGLPFLPGAVTATEAMTLFARGYDLLKFFPAEGAGGVKVLKGLAGPLPDISFCPTGGVSLENAESYLSLPNVAVAGGSWIAPADLVRAGDWDAIEARARAASALSRG
ncbi:bifunctional 4-hydroxy-2-oxoglutarate aldolase/2-dehydro-3-deoxy-phosphogluconate aldolase [Sulfitobacter albidus]|uniref:2-dehydro-3-deoxy-phosphogluconate aldolase n=1 Tax=Sulfitobacter albidus TaxID=2829501 RepID=A0A975JE84_9RHOB|nr:bifunctional 4-hydroxy-2-oxoglutarate aldolase/2-dehydro-3-deoxy-phosphogluconate aldolase [Sulfitobacter albidus]QUJ76854.1 bifunctional 4-hydroxy-2-oxoglutarate aldolase/2-dehydro-3-deoxy-phosphogluconate aldolase [Sulfitobacter albidus]